jgi:glycosyltransferase involved in cell wall biosynthesis
MEQMAQSQWIATLRKLGHEVRIHNLRLKSVDPRVNLPKLVSAVLDAYPEIIFVEGAIGFNLPEFYLYRDIRPVPVASFWFDDPMRTVECWKTEPGYLDALRSANVHHFVWDGYWRKWLLDHHSVHSSPIHLGADPDEFRPGPRPLEHQNSVVFVGTLVSPSHLRAEWENLPVVLQPVINDLACAMKQAPYGFNPYEILEEVIAGQSEKVRQACDILMKKDPEAILHLRGIAWKMGKNEVRGRILRETLKVSPLLMLCGNFEKTHANEREVRDLLRCDSSRLTVLDTRNVPVSDISNLYAFGKIHIQATDPQSVEGGIPFRVFQTTACRRPLLTDKRAELADCYSYDEEILTYDSEKDFAEKLEQALADSDRLDRVAEAGYRRFLKEHTWRHRFDCVRKQVLGG